MKQIDYRIVLAVVVCITIIECVALLKGINGTLLIITIGALCTIGGVAIPREIIRS